MTEFLAHSPKGDISAQTYAKHVICVERFARRYAREVQDYGAVDGDLLFSTVKTAAAYHDLGKLDDENQIALSHEKTVAPLPINHTDAGTAFLLNDTTFALLSAIVTRSHHIGLPDFIAESTRGEADAFRDEKIKAHVDSTLPLLVSRHKQLINTEPKLMSNAPIGDMSVFMRLALSCLVDADHTDTAKNYGNYPQEELPIDLRPLERLNLLDQYVQSLSRTDDERSNLRNKMYKACKASAASNNIVSCDAPVGSGKTTAIMANLLLQAKEGIYDEFLWCCHLQISSNNRWMFTVRH